MTLNRKVSKLAISSTLKILERTRLEVTRTLPLPGEVLVKVNDVVQPQTVIAKTDYVRGIPQVVDLQAEFGLKIEPELLDSILLKKVGDKVQKKETIARYQKDFWSGVMEVKSPCTGTIQYISKTQARIVIREDPKAAQPLAVVPVSKKLRIKPRWIRMYTQVKEGDFVREGQLIAGIPGFGSTDAVYAPISGVVERICARTGNIIIVRRIRSIQVLAQVKGKVTRIIPNRGAVINAFGSYIEGVFGIGGERFGTICVLTESPADILDESDINDGVKGKIIVAGAFATYEAIQKARSLGALGLIVGGINQMDIEGMLGEKLGSEISEEEFDFTIVLLEGFGKMPMNPRAWQILKRANGKIASIDGATQIYGTRIRPQVLITENLLSETKDHFGRTEVVAQGQSERVNERIYGSTTIAVGDRVRCIRDPYFGLWGVVEEIPKQPERVECEGIVEVVRVRLDDKRLVSVPEANIEVFKT